MTFNDEWIDPEDELPELEFSAGHGYWWRSKRVLIYHEEQGRQFARLYAGENQAEKWWRPNRAGPIWKPEDIIAWRDNPYIDPERIKFYCLAKQPLATK
jgi:hypothetical protein